MVTVYWNTIKRAGITKLYLPIILDKHKKQNWKTQPDRQSVIVVLAQVILRLQQNRERGFFM